MTYLDLITEVKKLSFEEIRSNSNQLFEMVIRTDKAQNLQSILEQYFGPALKPAGVQPSNDAAKKAVAHGGVRKEQTLYYLEQGSESSYAMIWPWSNGILITLKIAQNARKS